MRKGDKDFLDQKRQAIGLMELAGCPIKKTCDPQEWGKLQQVLAPDFRLEIHCIPIQKEYTAMAIRVHLQRTGEQKMFERLIG